MLEHYSTQNSLQLLQNDIVYLADRCGSTTVQTNPSNRMTKRTTFLTCQLVNKINDFGSPDKPGGLSIQLCKSEKKEFYIRYSS